MSLSGIYNIGESALIASQTALAVTSNNIANVNTPGYSEEAVTLSAANPVATGAGSIGSGVTATGVTRSYDSFLQTQLLDQQQNQSQSSALNQAWGQVQQVLNDSQNTGLSGPLNDFFNAWSSVAASPDSSAARITLLQSADALVSAASTIGSSITNTINSANTAITNDVSQVNTLASDIASLNGQIIQQGGDTSGTQACILEDQRDADLTALAKLTSFSSYQDSNGSINITVGMSNLVSGTQTNTMSTTQGANGNQAVILNGTDITSSIQGGDIGGQIASVNGIQSNTLTSLQTLITSLTLQVNNLQSSGFGLDGSTGNDFFNAPQLTTLNNSTNANITAVVSDEANLTANAYNFTFSDGDYSVYNQQTGALVTGPTAYTAGTPIDLSASIGMTVTIPVGAPAAGSFTISPLNTAISNFGVALTDPNQVAAASTAAGVPGDNGIANQISQLTGASISALGNNTFSEYYSGIVATVGSQNESASNSLTFDNNLLSSLQNQSASVSGVSLDTEATNLLLEQRAYEAASQVVKAADELVQTLLSMFPTS